MHSLPGIADVLPSETLLGVDREDEAVCGGQELCERASSQSRMSGNVDKMQWASEDNGER